VNDAEASIGPVFVRAAATAAVLPPPVGAAVAFGDVDLQRVAQHLYALMLRNVASDGYPLIDASREVLSCPGCVIAAPSSPGNTPGISQDYLFNWVRDAAITALELAAAAPTEAGEPVEALGDYVRFAVRCRDNAPATPGHACFTVDGRPRPWSEQNDGPALQTLAILAAWDLLDQDTRGTATALVQDNIDYLLSCYRDATTNVWEEHQGFSFFARAVQLRCLQAVAGANPAGFVAPAGTGEAITWLQTALAAHWDEAAQRYVSVIGGTAPGDAAQPVAPDYDPNIDVVQAAVYGAIPVTDPKLLATAAALRKVWADPSSAELFPINLADAQEGVGPMFGRYPGDRYDGGSGGLGDHPWALCTANVAQLYYDLAAEIQTSGAVPLQDLSREFFTQVGITGASTADAAVGALQSAGDALLRAVLRHSDHLELSEQFDGVTGYERSVRNLTWSYAAFLSAVRARTRIPVEG
jgi:glucoamylase